MRKTFKYRLHPTRAQITALDQQLAEACSLYNAALQERRDAWKMQRVSRNYYDQAKQLKEIRDEGNLELANFSACQDVLRRVSKTFDAFFRRLETGETPGYPRFKPRSRFDSYTFPAWGDGCHLDAGRLKVQGVGVIKLKMHRPIAGQIKTLSLKREAGKWYACFSVECDAEPFPESHEAVGIDVGLESFAVLSNDEPPIPNPRFFRTDEKALAKAQRKLSALEKRTPQRSKAKRVVVRIHERIRNRRSNFAHQVSRDIVNRFGIISVEDLNIKGMVQNHCLAKTISDAAWGMFRTYLSYKAENAGRICIPVPPAYTSQDCSRCGHRHEITLSTRVFHCQCCGLVINRDRNASLNILARGLASLALA